MWNFDNLGATAKFFLRAALVPSTLIASLYAGVSSAEKAPIQDAVRKAIAKKFDLPPDSPLIDASLQGMRNPKPKSTPIPNLPVVRHLRGTEGLAFTTEAEIGAEDQKIYEANLEKHQEMLKNEQVQKSMKETLELLKNPPPETAEAPALKSCERDVTITNLLEDPSRTSPVLKTEKVIGDILFIKAPVPMDPDLAFGRNTSVIQYTTKPGDYLSLVAASEGIQCLPYRIRITSHHSIHDMGLNALKNYDNVQKGEIYEGIKARLHVYR